MLNRWIPKAHIKGYLLALVRVLCFDSLLWFFALVLCFSSELNRWIPKERHTSKDTDLLWLRCFGSGSLLWFRCLTDGYQRNGTHQRIFTCFGSDALVRVLCFSSELNQWIPTERHTSKDTDLLWLRCFGSGSLL